jgi:hypothetical protein
MLMHHIVTCGLYGSTVFFHIISSAERFSKKVIKHKMCVLFPLQLLSETFLILRRIEGDMITDVY